MSKYCPTCLGEYKHSLKTCPKDQSPLSEQKPKAYERLVDFYAATDELECERIISLLQAEGILARESVAGISQVPVASDSSFYIAVLKEERKEAVSLIEQARIDGIISQNGTFL